MTTRAADRPFRFGMVFTDEIGGPGWTDLARRLEGDGFATLLVADHYHNPMACGPLLTAAAAATTTLRIGSYVYDNDFRHPALLAKEVATIDVLSEGRMEFGIGAGWAKAEYDEAGVPFDPPGVRVSRLEESLDVLDRLFAGEAVHHSGDHYRLAGLEGAPRPVQAPIPLLVGGGGPRMLGIAARRAQIVGLVPPSLPGGGLDPEKFAAAAMDRKIAALDAAVADAGRLDGGPERSVLVFGLYGSIDEASEEDWVRPDLVSASPYALVGDTAAMVDTLLERRERWGLSYVVCFEADVERFTPVVKALA
jgi:probable F420-dependent oxidoreductase